MIQDYRSIYMILLTYIYCAITVNDGFASPFQAFEFDGDNDYIALPNNDLTFGRIGTFETWLYLDECRGRLISTV